jgi:CBS domain-containing protein
MLQTRARRIPLIDADDETGRETVVSVITQYRILKFIAVNNEKNTVLLRKSLREIKLGTYTDLATADMNSSGSVGDALCRRSDEFQGIYTCTEEDRLDSIFDTVRKSRVHRLIVVDDESRLRGIISLSDILKYVLIDGEEEHM